MKTKAALVVLVLAATAYQYKRTDYRHWIDADKDCQNTRQEVLISSLVEGSIYELAQNGCSVTKGLWVDPYTGEIHNNPATLDIDHVVPLAHAHQVGAAGWSRQKKKKFANDLENLIAVSAQQNRQKGRKGPDKWLPKDRSYHCRYVKRWLSIKAKYELFLTAGEVEAIIKIEKEGWC